MPEPLTRETLQGVWCALIMPWTDDDQLDENRLVAEVRAYGGTGVHGVYTGGTTGEWYAQDDETFRRATDICVREAHAVDLPIQIGCTALSNRTARQRIRYAIDAGADAIQIALPLWLQLQDDEVMSFLDAVVDEAGRTPIVLYVTDRSKRRLDPMMLGEVTRRYPTVIGTKDTAISVDELRAILAEAPDLAVFGSENFLERHPAGGRGGYCSITGLNARAIVRLYNAVVENRLEEARRLDAQVRGYLETCLIPLIRERGLLDSAIDRLQRVAGGVDVGVRCQGPYRSGSMQDVENLLLWVKRNAPDLHPGA